MDKLEPKISEYLKALDKNSLILEHTFKSQKKEEASKKRPAFDQTKAEVAFIPEASYSMPIQSHTPVKHHHFLHQKRHHSWERLHSYDILDKWVSSITMNLCTENGRCDYN